MWGDSESAFKNTQFQLPGALFEKSRNSSVEWLSTLGQIYNSMFYNNVSSNQMHFAYTEERNDSARAKSGAG